LKRQGLYVEKKRKKKGINKSLEVCTVFNRGKKSGDKNTLRKKVRKLKSSEKRKEKSPKEAKPKRNTCFRGTGT